MIHIRHARCGWELMKAFTKLSISECETVIFSWCCCGCTELCKVLTGIILREKKPVIFKKRKKKVHSVLTFWTFDSQLQQLIVVEAGLVQIFILYYQENKQNSFLIRYMFVSFQGLILLTSKSAYTSQIYTFKKMYKTRFVWMTFATCENFPDDREDNTTASKQSEEEEDVQKKVGDHSDVKSPAAERQSLCSIFTFGGLRKDLFFFSLLFFPCAWNDLQLSTRPSRDSLYVWLTEQIHLRSLQKKKKNIIVKWLQLYNITSIK